MGGPLNEINACRLALAAAREYRSRANPDHPYALLLEANAGVRVARLADRAEACGLLHQSMAIYGKLDAMPGRPEPEQWVAGFEEAKRRMAGCR